MKSWLNKYLILFLVPMALMSCEKDEELTVLNEGTAPALSASANTVVLTEDNAEDEALTLNWNASDFGFQAAVTYTIEIDTANNNFATPATIGMGSSLEKSFTVEELNTLLTKLKYEPEVAQDMKVRVKATVSDLVNPVYSDVETISVTPYSTYVEPSFIYAPGGYQGWNPSTAPALISVNSDGIYKGILSFVGADSREFKFTDERSWDLNWGGGATEGSLAINGSNLTVPTADSYEVEVNINNMTWTSKKYSWGVIGSATPGGWDNDTNLKYINEEGVWKGTVNLTAGEIKFRLNDAWDLNYGDDGANNMLEANGANIVVSEAGSYEIVLDLETEDGVPTYTVTKI